MVSNNYSDILQYRFIFCPQVTPIEKKKCFLMIDEFFSSSGLLTAFTYFISKTENEKFSVVKFFLNHYVYHYLR